MSSALAFALTLMGFTFTIAQVVVIRELLVVFSGNELSVAVILAHWLILGAAGSFILGRRVEKFGWKAKGFAWVQLFLSFSLPTVLFAIRSLREFIGLSFGEEASLLQIYLWTIPLLAPLGFINGILFSLGCSLYAEWSQKGISSLGRVYLLEALGAGIGGILYSFFFIPHFDSFQVTYLLGVGNLLAGLLLLLIRGSGPLHSKRNLFVLLGVGILGNLVLLFFPGVWNLEKISIRRQWKEIQVIDSRWSPYGNVMVGRRAEQVTVFANGLPICTTPVPDIARMEEKAHYPLLNHGRPRKILVIGGGPGGFIQEILKHPVEELHYAEIDPLILQLIQENVGPLSGVELEDPRVKIHLLDGRFFIRTCKERFDNVFLSLPYPLTLELNRYFTVNFFQEVRRSLREGGLFSFSLPGSESYLSPEGKNLNGSLLGSLQQVFSSVQMIPGDENIFIAAKSKPADSLNPELFIQRWRERKLQTRFITPFQIQDKLQAGKQKWLEESLARGKSPKLNRDEQPVGLYYGIAFWNAQFHPGFQKIWEKIENLRLWHFALLGLVLFGIFSFWLRRERVAEKVILWTVGTTGFYSISMTLILIFSFQTLYGYVYQWLGLLIAAFMSGLAIGGFTATQGIGKGVPWRKFFFALEGGIVLFLILFFFLISRFYEGGGNEGGVATVQIIFLLGSIVTGFTVGFEFSLAGLFFVDGQAKIGEISGALYAADLIGAWAGALIAGVILVPVLGIQQTILGIGLLKLTSLVWLFWGAIIKKDLFPI